MSSGKKLIAILVWFSLIFTLGVYVFTRGFLLQRLGIVQNSTCSEADFTHISDTTGMDGCWMHARFKRVVIVLIDALRYDFLTYDPSLQATDTKPFQNKLPHVDNLLKTVPQNARLYKFLADPPTTTLQRLLGLTTGSFPTFVDVSSNFASTEIREDSIIGQLEKNGKKATFIGDETWIGLFPTQFHKTFPFPPFNVKDLHTGDNFVLSHLEPEMRKQDWDVLIAHLNGVDHCGHRYGPYHPAMAEKLTQMDSMLRNVTKLIDEDTVLMVFGDHGMTKTGDHGGDSSDEVEAGLFMYSKSQLTNTPPPKVNKVYQVDLVPTFSLLLGIPIPYSNLGTVITELFDHCPWKKTQNNRVQQAFHIVKALHLNAHQIQRYLETYHKLSTDFPSVRYEQMKLLFSQIESDLQYVITQLVQHGDEQGLLRKLKSIQNRYLRYLTEVKSMCRDIWAKFDEKIILLGIMTTAIAVFSICSLYLMADNLVEQIPRHFYCSLILLLLVGLIYVIRESDPLFFVFGVSFFGSGLFMAFVNKTVSMKSFRIRRFVKSLVSVNGLAGFCLLLNTACIFSNSYTVHEDGILGFLLQTLATAIGFAIVQKLLSVPPAEPGRKRKSLPFDIGRYLTSPTFLAICLLFVFSLCLRLSFNFRACREEQWTCVPSNFMKSLSALADTDPMMRNLRYFMTAASALLVPVIIYSLCRHNGNLNGYAPGVLCFRYTIPFAAICISLHWAVQAMPPKILDSLPPWQQIGFARVVFVLCILSIMTALIQPLCIFLLEQDDSDYLMGISRRDIVPKVYNHLKLQIRKKLDSGHNSNSSKPPLVYGLGTVYSTSQILLTVAVGHLVTILLNIGFTPSMFLAVMCVGLCLELFAVYIHCRSDSKISIPWFMPIFWGFLSAEFFYNTGHQPTLSTLQWEAAYVGFHGDHSTHLIPAILMTMNTFGSQIFFSVALPLLLFWPYVRGRSIYMFQKRDEDSQETKGEFVLNEKSEHLQHSLFKLILGFITFHSVKLLASMCAAAILRKHLMVWKIFAPKFMFEAASFLVVNATCLLTFLFVLRVDKAVSNWVDKLCQKQKTQ